MNKKERENLEALQEVCEYAVCYVGQANYTERQSLAEWNVRKAFEDFANGRKIEWTEKGEEEE